MPNETLTLGPQNFQKKLHRKKFQKKTVLGLQIDQKKILT